MTDHVFPIASTNPNTRARAHRLAWCAGLCVSLASPLALAQSGLSELAPEESASLLPGLSMFAADEGDEPDFDGFAEEDPGDLDISVDEYDLVDLHVSGEDLGQVLQLLSIQSERNIVASNGVTATITADLYGVTFYEALDAILHVNGFGYIERGNFIYVYSAEELATLEATARERVTRVHHLDYLNATDAAEFVNQLLSENGVIKTNAQTEPYSLDAANPSGADSFASDATLVIHDYEENVEAIVELLGQLDTRPVQVLVEATILQTSLNEDNAFGVDFSILNNIDFASFAGFGGPLSAVNGLIQGASAVVDGTPVVAPTSASGNGAAITTSIGNVAGNATLKAGLVNEDVGAFIRLLDEVTDVTVVSNPKILTLNRQPARVLVGTRVGYLNSTTTETSTTQSVEFLDTGTQLAVRPFVTDGGVIRLELKPQVSNFTLREVTNNTGATITIPDEETTELVTNVLLRDSQTVVLGGLFTEATTATRRQVPLLGDIPLVGTAFRGHEDSVTRSEIIFMITPSIVDDEDLAQIGDEANDYVTEARVGARKGLLPTSRSRQVARLLIRARQLEEEGKISAALFRIDRALALSPASIEAKSMRSRLSGLDSITPSNSVLDSVLGNSFLISPPSRDETTGQATPGFDPIGAPGEAPAPSHGLDETASADTGQTLGAAADHGQSNPFVETLSDDEFESTFQSQSQAQAQNQTQTTTPEAIDFVSGVNPEFIETVDDAEFDAIAGDQNDAGVSSEAQPSFDELYPAQSADAGSGVDSSFIERVEPEQLEGWPEVEQETALFGLEGSSGADGDTASIGDAPGGLAPTEIRASGGFGAFAGPVLAPEGAEVLWIPLPGGQVVRVPLLGGAVEVLEGESMGESYAEVETWIPASED